MRIFCSRPRVFLVALTLSGALLTGGAGSLLSVCGPFTDVSDAAFCPFVLEIFYLGITTGTTPTTYDPSGNVTRLQMAAFLSRGVDGILKRGSRRAALDQLWTPRNATALALTPVGLSPFGVRSDGTDIWVASFSDNKVFRVRGGDGKLLETWTGAGTALGVAVAMGRIFVTGDTDPGKLYRIDPTQPAGVVTTVATNLADFPFGIAFDGGRLWASGNGSMSIVTPGASLPWSVTTVTTGFARPNAVLTTEPTSGSRTSAPGLFSSSMTMARSCRRSRSVPVPDTRPSTEEASGFRSAIPPPPFPSSGPPTAPS